MVADFSVLVVDDEEDLRNLCEHILSILGTKLELKFDITLASSAEEAWEKVDAVGGSFDIIISDVNMSGETGIDFFLRCKREGIDTPFILMTADPANENPAEEAGIENVLIKPFIPGQLVKIVGLVLGIEIFSVFQ